MELYLLLLCVYNSDHIHNMHAQTVADAFVMIMYCIALHWCETKYSCWLSPKIPLSIICHDVLSPFSCVNLWLEFISLKTFTGHLCMNKFALMRWSVALCAVCSVQPAGCNSQLPFSWLLHGKIRMQHTHFVFELSRVWCANCNAHGNRTRDLCKLGQYLKIETTAHTHCTTQQSIHMMCMKCVRLVLVLFLLSFQLLPWKDAILVVIFEWRRRRHAMRCHPIQPCSNSVTTLRTDTVNKHYKPYNQSVFAPFFCSL